MLRHRPLHFASAASLMLLAAGALAAPAEDDRWALCPALPPAPEVPRQGTEVTHLSADSAQAEGQDRSLFIGNVEVIRDGQRLNADRAVYDKATDTLDAQGNVDFFSESISFSGESAHLRLSDNIGFISAARYRVSSAHAFGTAERVEFEGTTHSKLKGATYTTCPPGDEAWLLAGDEITLDRETNTGEAHNAVLELGGVPVFYFPYLNFPLEGRKSGLLTPTFEPSERNGTDLSLPWYWNIAPNRDATITPRIISKRGTMVMSEFRYLNEESSGTLNADVLPDDQLADGDTRSSVQYRHGQRLSDRWNAALLYQEVSDPAYLNDIDNSLASSSATHLERRFDLTYRGDGWTFLGRVQDYQQLLESEPEYQRMPQLRADGDWRSGPFAYNLRTEYVNFASDKRDPSGSRVDLYAGVSLPLRGSYWFITPRVAGRHTQYDLTDTTGDETPSRTLPITSLDSGLIFERELRLFDTPLVQTLEPRVYYLHVPFADQTDQPDFDTSAMTFSFDQLFRENRYTGADRVSDANQVTVALTSRLLRDDTGGEAARASIAQIRYLSEPEVVLPGETVEDRGYSDLAGELAARPIESVEISAATRWNPDEADARESSARLRYRPDEHHLLDAAWRYRDSGAEMNRDMLVLWPVTPNWQFIGRWYYDLVAERTLESVIGLQYESCCWNVRVALRDKPFLDDDGELQSDHSIYFTFGLKGLADVGQGLNSLIKDGMVGLD